jgi:hypothetical protein
VLYRVNIETISDIEQVKNEKKSFTFR